MVLSKRALSRLRQYSPAQELFLKMARSELDTFSVRSDIDIAQAPGLGDYIIFGGSSIQMSTALKELQDFGVIGQFSGEGRLVYYFMHEYKNRRVERNVSTRRALIKQVVQ